MSKPVPCASVFSGRYLEYPPPADLQGSERAFERRFTRLVGMPPARYRRLARFRRLLSQHRGGRDWATAAAAAGYSDQAHLVRDFRAFAGVTPSAWARAQTTHAGFVQDAGVTMV